MNKKRILIIILTLILISDFTYSFLQYYNTPLDGDMASGIIPDTEVQKIFNDPFGFGVIADGKTHPNPNRYFAHLSFKTYFQHIPLLFQKFVSPIDSIYYSSATIKLLIQIMFIYLLSALISKSTFNLKLLIVAVLLTPLFQTYGYHIYMGIIDNSITYTFFYALPLLILLFFLSNFYSCTNNSHIKISTRRKVVLALLTIILPFSGPLISPMILIIMLLLLLFYLVKHFKNNGHHYKLKPFFSHISKDILLFFIPISILSIYSLFLGTYNSTFQSEYTPLIERYFKLPLGIYYQLTQKLGLPILFLMIASNIFIIKKYYNSKNGQKIVSDLKWIGLFSLLYILLLPFGGYRPYRSNILRYDTIMPITIGLFYVYGASTFFILKNINKNKYAYYIIVFTFLLIFTYADISSLDENKCEKQALITISNSDKPIVLLKENCNVISWKPFTDFNDSKLNAKLLKMWNITDDLKLYYCSD